MMLYKSRDMYYCLLTILRKPLKGAYPVSGSITIAGISKALVSWILYPTHVSSFVSNLATAVNNPHQKMANINTLVRSDILLPIVPAIPYRFFVLHLPKNPSPSECPRFTAHAG
jgi:hypothetical protein